MPHHSEPESKVKRVNVLRAARKDRTVLVFVLVVLVMVASVAIYQKRNETVRREASQPEARQRRTLTDEQYMQQVLNDYTDALSMLPTEESKEEAYAGFR